MTTRFQSNVATLPAANTQAPAGQALPPARPFTMSVAGGNQQTQQRTAREDRPKAELWLNVGVIMPIANEDGVVEDVFVSLPMGLALDTMEPMEIKGSNQRWNALVAAKNLLREKLTAACSDIPSGGDNILDGLLVQAKRVGEVAAPDPSTNPFLAGIEAMFAGIGNSVAAPTK